jgi:predicted RNA binding protein YcfA (HicA-like mRNA interferase family)
MVKKVKAVIAALERDGWVHKRTRGDHRVFYKTGEKRSIPVPGNLNDDVLVGTLKSILRQAGLKEEDI